MKHLGNSSPPLRRLWQEGRYRKALAVATDSLCEVMQEIALLNCPYKHFYSEAQGEIGEAGNTIGGELGAGSEWPGGIGF
jgi:hypothetical protein